MAMMKMKRILAAIFGGDVDEPESDDTATNKGPGRQNQNDVALETFRHRISTGSVGYTHYQRAPGFDYIHWKPHGKRRRRYFPDEYVKTCKLLAPYVHDVALVGYMGLEEKRWAGIGELVPLGAKGYAGSMAGSLRGSRDILAKMGAGPFN